MRENIKVLPIHIHLTVIILFIVVIASGVQIFVTNKGLSTLILEANNKLFDRIELETRYKLICSSQSGHLTKRHFVFQSSLGLGTQEHCAFSFDYNQPQCTRRSFDASALSS
ncbi:hypothetical protein VCRA2119O430_20042 [Vibrio crassostreae]|nr:hypothetical protein VCRA2118O429_10042 [Vibrio crassostreae]CAK1962551.1 hypothetical protein VCRA2113O416_20042 [Vibrio crassostreae]CAK1968659.1 hypothetical protein VCRA2117O428_20042 [Vibrio crassostreae]CAK1970554.1 hypothetical protein VCRA2119O430_20042 [Vibrio crassostreae]CAK2147953.1 hypothetical protein VCRA2113O412_60042 [Vibrio crassostreae]